MIGRWIAAIAGTVVAVCLVWGLRALIVPIAVGALLAYVCHPLVARLERYKLTRGLAIGVLLLVFLSAALLLVFRIRAGAPTEIGTLNFKTRALYKVNERYEDLMDLDSTAGGSRLYRFVHDDLDPVMDRINRLLALTAEEHTRFLNWHTQEASRTAESVALLDYDRANYETFARRGLLAPEGRSADAAPPPARDGTPARVRKTPLGSLVGILSIWIVAPVVFFFLLSDTGEIKRGFLRLIPNRLFEPALAVLNDLDRALGGYVRGLFLECCFLGLTMTVVFATVGIPLHWAIPLGLVAGVTNVVPYLGSAVALLAGLSYTLLADGLHPLLPMIRADNAAIWVIVGVLFAELLKNVVFEPFIFGGAVKLHPLVVVIGVLGGGMLFGLAGLLLAIPTMTIVNAFVSSASTQLKAYGLV